MDHRVVSLFTYFLSRKNTYACTCIQCVCVLACFLAYVRVRVQPSLHFCAGVRSLYCAREDAGDERLWILRGVKITDWQRLIIKEVPWCWSLVLFFFFNCVNAPKKLGFFLHYKLLKGSNYVAFNLREKISALPFSSVQNVFLVSTTICSILFLAD